MVQCADTALLIIKAYNDRNWAAIEEACASTLSFYDNTLSIGGSTKQEYVQYWQGFCRAMTNQVISDVEVFGSGNFVVTTMTCSGNHDGADFLPGVVASNRHVSNRLCALWQCDDHGNLVSNEWFWDLLTVLRALGHVDIPLR